MYAQTRPRFMLSPERVLGELSQNPYKLKEKNPLYREKKNSSEEDRAHDAASSSTASPTHYQRAIQALRVNKSDISSKKKKKKKKRTRASKCLSFSFGSMGTCISGAYCAHAYCFVCLVIVCSFACLLACLRDDLYLV